MLWLGIEPSEGKDDEPRLDLLTAWEGCLCDKSTYTLTTEYSLIFSTNCIYICVVRDITWLGFAKQ